MRLLFAVLAGSFLFISCQNQTPAVDKTTPAPDSIALHIQALKNTAVVGDLIVRLSEDLISYQVKAINETDKSYSHAGIIIEQNGQKYVAHISPENPGFDTIQYIPIDSFINPAKNLNCALYRYELSQKERDSLQRFIARLKAENVRFDHVYNLYSDSLMYCSEMISKALRSVTHNRIDCKISTIPPGMVRLVYSYFRKEKITPQALAKRKIVTIDNLYLRPDCSKLMQFSLKNIQ